MLNRFRDWMHGKGRTAVMIFVALVALCIVLNYFLVERNGQWGANPVASATPTPKPMEETVVGGDHLGVAPSIVPTAESQKDSDTGENQNIHLGFAGDICLDDSCAVMRHMREEGTLQNVIDPKLIRKMKSYDCMVINNEFAISDRGTPMPGKAFTFRAKSKNVSLLKKLGVDVVSLANNHIFDYGKEAFMDTIKYLKQAGIAYTGGGKNAKEAQKPVMITVKGKRIAIIAATRAEKYILTPEAGKKSPGVFRTYDDTNYVKVIKRAKKKADYVIAFVHWGTEYSTELEEAQTTQAKDYIDAGADVVVGAHTHCLQGVGYYKGKPIFYSLGNFWFNEKTLYTTVLEIDAAPNGTVTTRMLPCLQKDRETRLLTEKKQIRKFTDYVNDISLSGKLKADGTVIEKN